MATSCTLSANSVLSDDYIYTSDVVVDAASTSPVAMFQGTTGLTALIVGADHVLRQVAPAPAGQSASGWNVVTVGSTSGITQIAAATQNDGSIHGFYTDAANLYHITLERDAWSAPDTLPLCSGLQAVTNGDTGELIVTGVDASGALLFVRQNGDGSWSAASIPFPTSLAGTVPVLVLTDADCDWTMALPDNTSGGGIDLYRGTPSAMLSGPDMLEVPAAVSQVILGMWMNNSGVFLFNDAKGNLYTTDGAHVTPVATAGIAIQSAAAILDLQSQIHLFTVSPDGTVAVLHQNGWSDGPLWAPLIPLNSGIQTVYADMNPTDTTAFFAVDANNALWHVVQDSPTSPWRSGKVQAPGGSRSYRVAQYRTEITVADANGNPVANLAVAVTASRASSVTIGGQHYPVGPSQSAVVTTNALGRATLSTIAAGLDSAALTFSASGLAATSAVNPATALHDYLTGNGVLNAGTSQTRPVFSASTLQQASVGGAPLAPQTQDGDIGTQRAQTAFDGIGAMFSLAPPGGKRGPGPAGIVGYTCDLAGPKPFFRTHTSHSDFASARHHLLASAGPGAGFDDWWDDIKDFFEDLLRGIENGVVTILKFAVHEADQAVDLVVQIGDEIHKLEKAAINGIKQVVSIVQGILAQVGAFIEEVIEWLKMLFDWGDIWNTMKALESALGGAFPYIQKAIEQKAEPLVNGFFSRLEQQVAVAFDTVAARYGNGETLGSTVPATAVHDRRAPARPRIDGPSQAVLTAWLAQAQNNWLFEKIESYLGGGSFASVGGLDVPLNNLKSDFDKVKDDFSDAINVFANFIIASASDPKDFPQIAIAAFLEAAKDVALAALAFMDGIVTTLLAVVAAGAGAAGHILSQPVEVPFLSSLVGDIASLIGVKLPSFSFARLFCLAFAIPITLLYKIVNGVEHQPFPGGELPTGSAPPGASLGASDGARACQFVAAGLAALWALFDTGLDAVDDVDLMALKVIDVVGPALIGVFTWPGYIPFSAIPFETGEEIAAFCDWLVGWAVVALDVALLLVSGVTWAEGSMMARYQDPVGKILLTAVGALYLIAGIVASAFGPSGGSIAANLLGPLPLLTQVLRLESVEAASDELSLAIKLIADFFAGEGYAVAVATS